MSSEWQPPVNILFFKFKSPLVKTRGKGAQAPPQELWARLVDGSGEKDNETKGDRSCDVTPRFLLIGI